MYKKLITACMALAAFAALAIMPASAMAENSPTLHDKAGHLAVGAQVVGTSVGNTFFDNTAGEPQLTCTTALMTGTIHRNSNGIVEVTISTADFGGTAPKEAGEPKPECTGNFGGVSVTVLGHLCVRSDTTMPTHEFQVTAGACTTAGGNVKFILDSTTVGECEYETTSSVKGDYTTGAGGTMTVRNTQAGSGSKKIRGGFFCPSSGMLAMAFTLETENGEEVTSV